MSYFLLFVNAVLADTQMQWQLTHFDYAVLVAMAYCNVYLNLPSVVLVQFIITDFSVK